MEGVIGVVGEVGERSGVVKGDGVDKRFIGSMVLISNTLFVCVIIYSIFFNVNINTRKPCEDAPGPSLIKTFFRRFDPGQLGSNHSCKSTVEKPQ